jgi:hypothetical protein
MVFLVFLMRGRAEYKPDRAMFMGTGSFKPTGAARPGRVHLTAIRVNGQELTLQEEL